MNTLARMMTECDNKTHDVFKYLALTTIIIAHGLQVYVVVVEGQVFDMQQFGIGVGVLFAGMGAALMMKPESKPDVPTAPTGAGQIP